MHLTSYEKETIITYNKADNTAHVYTCDSALMRKLDGFCADSQDIVMVKEDKYSKTYELPKKWVKVSKPRTYSEEYRKELSERAKRMCKARMMKKNSLNAHTTAEEGL